MFQFRYALNELRRRFGRTLVTALGLAIGVGLVSGIAGVSQGLQNAQEKVLQPLQSVGTDILVTRVAGVNEAGSSNDAAANVAGGFFGGGNRGQLNLDDTSALSKENSNVVTDLSKLGNPGDKFTRDFFLSATLLSFPDQAVADVSKINGVSSAVGGLSQLASHQTGTVPQIVAEIKTGGETIQQDINQAPMTDIERQQMAACIAQIQSSSNQPPSTSTNSSQPNNAGAQQRQPRAGGGGRGDFERCMPDRFRKLRAQFSVPLRSIQQAVNPPATDTTATSYTAAGVDPANENQGLVTKSQLTQGRWINQNAPQEVLLSTAYANKANLKVGAKIPINNSDYEVVGLVNPAISGENADIYFTLSRLQELAGKQGRVTQVLVKTKDASDVDRVVAEIRKQLPGAQVITTKDLTDKVTGSLSDAKKLNDRLGAALGVIVLIAAFAIAVLLTLSSVAKRTREIGTLRAVGWSRARIVRQVVTETLLIGTLGGLLGIGVAAIVCWSVSQFSPTFNATTVAIAGFNGSQYSSLFGQKAQAASSTTQIALHAPLEPWTLAIGFLFALAGGLIAGIIGGWRAARLAPSSALRTVG